MKKESPNDDIVLHLIKGCRKNDRVSQKLLYQHYYAYGRSISILYVKNRDEAADILNETFMKVFLNIKKFDVNMPFKSWFRKIVVNNSINHIRRNKRIFSGLSTDEAREFPIEETISSSIHYQEVVEMIQELPPAYRTIFNLHVIEGYKHEEIAELLGISVGASKSNLFKAKNKLRKILHRYLEKDYVKAERR